MEQTEQLRRGIGGLRGAPGWVCVHASACVCICVHMHLSVFKYMCVYMCAYVFVCRYMCAYMYVCVHMHLSVQVHVCVHVCVCRESAKEKGWSVGRIAWMNCMLTSIPSLQLLTEALAI